MLGRILGKLTRRKVKDEVAVGFDQLVIGWVKRQFKGLDVARQSGELARLRVELEELRKSPLVGIRELSELRVKFFRLGGLAGSVDILYTKFPTREALKADNSNSPEARAAYKIVVDRFDGTLSALALTNLAFAIFIPFVSNSFNLFSKLPTEEQSAITICIMAISIILFSIFEFWLLGRILAKPQNKAKNVIRTLLNEHSDRSEVIDLTSLVLDKLTELSGKQILNKRAISEWLEENLGPVGQELMQEFELGYRQAQFQPPDRKQILADIERSVGDLVRELVEIINLVEGAPFKEKREPVQREIETKQKEIVQLEDEIKFYTLVQRSIVSFVTEQYESLPYYRGKVETTKEALARSLANLDLDEVKMEQNPGRLPWVEQVEQVRGELQRRLNVELGKGRILEGIETLLLSNPDEAIIRVWAFGILDKIEDVGVFFESDTEVVIGKVRDIIREELIAKFKSDNSEAGEAFDKLLMRATKIYDTVAEDVAPRVVALIMEEVGASGSNQNTSLSKTNIEEGGEEIRVSWF
ncbi:MAG: hypothetical protein NZT61_04740 [Deltaproteobacteria bacterium]|nr:hypothetical protein [Deltaproteobacteria bacterium]